MYTGYTESPGKIAERRARIISTLPPRNAWEPTLDECLAMEAEETRRKQARSRQYWDDLMKELRELTAEIKERQATA